MAKKETNTKIENKPRMTGGATPSGSIYVSQDVNLALASAEEIAEKIVKGRVGKFYSEICLVDQEFVKNPDMMLFVSRPETAKEKWLHFEP